MTKPIALLISCEHAVNTVPAAYRKLFEGHEQVLQTHRGIDLGALEIASHLNQIFACGYTQATVSRLLIDCNRSLAHAHCFSEFTKNLPVAEKQKLIDQYYLPFRQQTENLIKAQVESGAQVLHLSIHSFTPELNGITRNAGIGLLYDHARHGEKEVARIWGSLLIQQTPAYRVRMNYPYHGNTDGFTTALRKIYTEHDYLGIEVESNQALLELPESRNEVANVLSASLQELLQLL